jgi:hypothetical protein
MKEGIGDNINELLSTTEKKKLANTTKRRTAWLKPPTLFFRVRRGQENISVDKYRVFELRCNATWDCLRVRKAS